MSRTESTMLPLGTPAPDFEVADVISGKSITLATLGNGKPLLIMFICRHCPYVKHVQLQLAKIGRDYADRVSILAISSNDAAAHPDDAPESLREMARELGFVFPYGYDVTQQAARAYTAACTPDFFLFDKDRRLVYRGQLDDSRRGNSVPVTGRDVRAAMDALLSGSAVNPDQRPSIGCNIKWIAN